MNTNIKKIKKLFFSLLLLLCAGFTSPALSQVTIGSLLPPQGGSLLDLKQQNETLGNSNSNKGIVLPRVALTNVNELFPMLTGTESNYLTSKPGYTGMVVFNVSTINGFKRGLYEWDGGKWNLMTTDALNPVQASNGLTVVNTNTVILGSPLPLTQPTSINLGSNNLIFNSSNGGRVGIKATNPQKLLDVGGDVNVGTTLTVRDTLRANGTVLLKKVDNAQGDVAQLAIDTLTGVVYKIVVNGNTNPINYLKYVINTSVGLSITDFNTNIPSKDYTLIVVGSSFNNPYGLKMKSGALYGATFAPLSIYAMVSGGTWHLVADYPGATTANDGTGTWTIDCVAINNSIVKTLPGQSYQMDPNQWVGDMGNPPPGL